MVAETTLRTAEINGVPCVLFYPKPVHAAVARALSDPPLVCHGMRARPRYVPASPILYSVIGARLGNALRLAKRRAA